LIFRRLSHNPQFTLGNSEVKFLFSSSKWKEKSSQGQVRVGALENLACPNCPFENTETPH